MCNKYCLEVARVPVPQHAVSTVVVVYRYKNCSNTVNTVASASGAQQHSPVELEEQMSYSGWSMEDQGTNLILDSYISFNPPPFY